MSRSLPDGAAGTVLRIGVPRLLRRVEDVARAIDAFDASRPTDLLRRLASIPGAEALSVLAQIPERDRTDLLREIGGEEQLISRLIASLQHVGLADDERSVAAVLRRLAPDITLPSERISAAATDSRAVLRLSFREPNEVTATFGEREARAPFASPFTAADWKDFASYAGGPGPYLLGEPDTRESNRLARQASVWGQRLFDAVFTDRETAQLFQNFLRSERPERDIVVSSPHAEVLALPWELMRDRSGGTDGWLFSRGIHIRRRWVGATAAPKTRTLRRGPLRFLFVTSRPDSLRSRDSHLATRPVLDALDQRVAGRCSIEFLRPPTIDALRARLADKDAGPIDVLHFDGYPTVDSRTDTSSLLFERTDGLVESVSAQNLAEAIRFDGPPLVVLSLWGMEFMGAFASQLVSAGVPAVLTVSSTLAVIRDALLPEFYVHLVQRGAVTEALDAARHVVHDAHKTQPAGEANREVSDSIQTWFVPSLLEGGDGVAPLRQAAEQVAVVRRPRSNLPPPPIGGFHGRVRELRTIERAFVDGTRRITITGLAGQGKTVLACEAARWLVSTRLFAAAVLVSCRSLPSSNAGAAAAAQIASVLEEAPADARLALPGLAGTATIIVLDGLDEMSGPSRHDLLDAAVPWSLAGESRVLVTSRRSVLEHPAYSDEMGPDHRQLALSTLGTVQQPDDALELMASLWELPPAPELPVPQRDKLIELFSRVDFNPLVVTLLAPQLKTTPVEALGQQLDRALSDADKHAEPPDRTLALSIDTAIGPLDGNAPKLLARLSVFSGGAFEDDLSAVVLLDDCTLEDWRRVRERLVLAGLIELEEVPEVQSPYVRFHPILAAIAGKRLPPAEREELVRTHRHRYFAVARYLHDADIHHPQMARAVVARDLNNLLQAIEATLTAGDPDAVEFVDVVIPFLKILGLHSAAERLTARLESLSGEQGATAWFRALSNRGDRLAEAGHLRQAIEEFQKVLAGLSESDSFERALTLGRLGRTLSSAGDVLQATKYVEQGLAIAATLPKQASSQRLISTLQSDFANLMATTGRLAEAQDAYRVALQIDRDLGDVRSQAVTLAQLANVAMTAGRLAEAVEGFQEALALFQRIHDPHNEATVWHQLGGVFQNAQRWDEAERHYRASMRLHESTGNLTAAARTSYQLGTVGLASGRYEMAEAWLRKAVATAEEMGDPLTLVKSLTVLAQSSQRQGRLAEARTLYERALTIERGLSPNISSIWNTLYLLAETVLAEASREESSTRRDSLIREVQRLRREARQTIRETAAGRHEVQRMAPVIVATALAIADPKQEKGLEEMLVELSGRGWAQLVSVIRRIIAGERDADTLCADLDLQDATIVEAILRGLDDPSSLADLLPAQR